MSRSNITIIAVVVGVVGIVVIAALAYAFLKPTEEASGSIEAVPLSAPDTDADSSDATDNDQASEHVDSSDEDAAVEGESEAVEESEATEEPVIVESEPILFAIVQAESEARFMIDEVLRGEPKTVVGVTDQVAGEILYNPADPSSAQVGTILVNARTLATDSGGRNRAIGNQILDTGDYEFISFTPTAISGLPDTAQVGEAVTFQITGDLTIRDVTREVTFEVTVVPVSADRLEGTATTIIIKEDYGLTIPNVPFVANVSEEVVLEIDFVAIRVG